MLPLGLWGTAPSGTVSSVAGRLMSTGPRWLILIEKTRLSTENTSL